MFVIFSSLENRCARTIEKIGMVAMYSDARLLSIVFSAQVIRLKRIILAVIPKRTQYFQKKIFSVLGNVMPRKIINEINTKNATINLIQTVTNVGTV